MSVPTSYDNAGLAEFMQRTIGPLAGILGLTNSGDYDEAVTNALLAYGVSDAEEADDIPRLRAFAEREVWRLARDYTVGHYDMRSPDGEQLSRSQIHKHAKDQLAELEKEIAKMTGAASVQRVTLQRSPDPYRREA